MDVIKAQITVARYFLSRKGISELAYDLNLVEGTRLNLVTRRNNDS